MKTLILCSLYYIQIIFYWRNFCPADRKLWKCLKTISIGCNYSAYDLEFVVNLWNVGSKWWIMKMNILRGVVFSHETTLSQRPKHFFNTRTLSSELDSFFHSNPNPDPNQVKKCIFREVLYVSLTTRVFISTSSFQLNIGVIFSRSTNQNNFPNLIEMLMIE